MTDTVKLALIAILPTSLAATATVISALNRSKLHEVGLAVNGNLASLRAELATASAALLKLTEKASLAEGAKIEQDRDKTM